MVASILTAENGVRAVDEFLRPAPLANGCEPEQRVVFNAISWKSYLAFDKKLGDDRPGPRLYFLEGQLEIMSTSDEHERLKTWLGGFMEDYFFQEGVEIFTRGQATMRSPLAEAGAEPDESWSIGAKKRFPDIVLEIALTSGGVSKLELYRRFKVPEVWFWRGNRLEIHVLGSSGNYKLSKTSRLLPDLDIPLLERCVAIDSWLQARRTFRAGLARRR